MGQYSKTIDHYSNNPDLPEWLAPYTSVRLRGKGTLRLYGFAREDWSMATRRFQEIQFPQWVLPQDSAYHSANSKDPITVDDNFNYDLFAKVTRLGRSISTSRMACWKVVVPGPGLKWIF